MDVLGPRRRRDDLAAVLDVAVFSRDLQAGDSDSTRHLCALAAELLHADDVAFAVLADGRCRTVGATGERPTEIDARQFGLGEGPSVSAMSSGQPVRSGDLANDRRWPAFGPATTQETDLRSVMALPSLVAGKLAGVMAAYAVRTDAFDATSERLGAVFAAHLAATIANEEATGRRTRLAEVLGRNRRIGTAMGILMADRGWTDNQAFEAMALEATWRYSRDGTSRIVDVADEVIRDRTPPAT